MNHTASGFGLFALASEGNIPPAAEWIPTHAVCLSMLSDSLPPACSVHGTEAMWDKSRFVAKKKSRCDASAFLFGCGGGI